VAETSDGLHVYVMNQRWSTRPRMLSSDTPQLNG
jgi:hypothetical protein